MGVTTIQSGQPTTHFGVAGAVAAPINQSLSFATSGNNRQALFDSFQRARTQPYLSVTTGQKLTQILLRPFQTVSLSRTLWADTTRTGEKLFERMAMYRALDNALDREGRKQLKALLKSGVLTDSASENNHSTLYQLYAILTTPRARGLDNAKILAETIEFLFKPYAITQKFAPLTENNAKMMLAVRNSNMGLNRAGALPLGQPLGWKDINVRNSATCVSASVMYAMADEDPCEFVRQINELTSPMQAFYETVQLTELSPDDPQAAFRILDEAHIKYNRVGNSAVTVKVELPAAGLVRTINDSNQPKHRNRRSGIETAYQSALSFMATRRTYDPATDLRDSETPGVGSKGLTEPEAALMESIIRDIGGVRSVVYQIANGKVNPQAHEQGMPFLYGYSRQFDQVTADIIDALKAGTDTNGKKRSIRIGITDTDASGAIVGGHEIRITGADYDKRRGEIVFTVVDSDDDNDKPVQRTARELIPRIHHACLPMAVGRRIESEIQKNTSYFVPSDEDTAFYQPIQFLQEPAPAGTMGLPDSLSTPTQAEVPQATVAQPATLPTSPAVQQNVAIDYVPVYAYPGSNGFYPSMPTNPFAMQPAGYGYYAA